MPSVLPSQIRAGDVIWPATNLPVKVVRWECHDDGGYRGMFSGMPPAPLLSSSRPETFGCCGLTVPPYTVTNALGGCPNHVLTDLSGHLLTVADRKPVTWLGEHPTVYNPGRFASARYCLRCLGWEWDGSCGRGLILHVQGAAVSVQRGRGYAVGSAPEEGHQAHVACHICNDAALAAGLLTRADVTAQAPVALRTAYESMREAPLTWVGGVPRRCAEHGDLWCVTCAMDEALRDQGHEVSTRAQRARNTIRPPGNASELREYH